MYAVVHVNRQMFPIEVIGPKYTLAEATDVLVNKVPKVEASKTARDGYWRDAYGAGWHIVKISS